MDDETIAQTIHEMARGLQYALNDPMPADPWQVADPDMRESVLVSVRAAHGLLAAPDRETVAGIDRASRELHGVWCRTKWAQGWTYGQAKDPAARPHPTHPCLVPWESLPLLQRLKNRLFLAVVREMTREDVP